MKDKLLKIINTYGISKTLKHLHSEHYELDESILNLPINISIGEMIKKDKYINHIAEEIADMMCMLFQLQLYYCISDKKISDVIAEKVERELKRMEVNNG